MYFTLFATASCNMRQNAYYGKLMLLLRNKDHQQKNPLPSSATQWRRQVNCRLTHYCMTPGPWMNLALAQCECPTGKWTVIARITSIIQNCAADFMLSWNFWFLGPVSKGKNAGFAPPVDAQASDSTLIRQKWPGHISQLTTWLHSYKSCWY